MTQIISDHPVTIVGKECRNIWHIPSKDNSIPDLHLIKEILHYSDGTTKPHVRLFKNFKRPFWITKPQYRNHKEKKEYEELENLNEYRCTESELRNTIAKSLNMGHTNKGLKDLLNIPYIYGADVMSTSLIKEEYNKKYPDFKTPYSICFYDIETNVFKDNKEIIIATIVFKNEILTCVLKSFLKGYNDPITYIDNAMDKYLKEYIDKHNYKCNTIICNTELELVQNIFNQIHKWQPDILSIWNQDFDINRTVEACNRAKVKPQDIFSDPTIPKELRYFKYKQGKKKKVTTSGKVSPIPPSSQWHQTIAPSSFVVIDAMCAYKRIRLSEPEEPSYSLDSILEKELGIRKLTFKEAEGHSGLAYHEFMQAKYKIEYIIYNRFDCISMQELDLKTQDLSYKLPMFAGNTDFNLFNLSTKKATDKMFFFLLEKNKILGSYGNNQEDEFTKDEDNGEEYKTLSLKDWIVTLPAHNVEYRNGLQCLEDSRYTHTNIRCFVSDSDAVSSYPSDTSALNVSKSTTIRELVKIEGISEYTFRRQNINLLSGSVNSVEYCTEMFNFPTLPDLLNIYQSSNCR